MKKLTVSLAVLLASYAANSSANLLPNTNASKCVSVPADCGGFTFGFAGLYWRPKTDHLDYALTFPSFTNGNFRHVHHDYDWGWKANIGYLFPCSGSDINLAYTEWDDDDNRHINGAAFPTTSAPFFFGGELPVVVPSVSFRLNFDVPGNPPTDGVLFIPAFEVFLGPEDITTIHARSRFQNNTWDLNFGQSINVGCNFNLHWFGGLRYTRLNHNLETTINFSSTQSVVFDETTIFIGNPLVSTFISLIPVLDVNVLLRDEVCQKSDFNGVGPEFGIDTTYRLGCGFGVTGQLLTSLLVGEIESSYSERIKATIATALNVDATEITSGGVPIIAVEPAVNEVTVPVADFSFRHPHETRVVPNIDAKLALDWAYTACNASHSKLKIEAGYMVSHFFNGIDRLSGVELFAPEVRPRQALDVSFDGPYVGVQVNL